MFGGAGGEAGAHELLLTLRVPLTHRITLNLSAHTAASETIRAVDKTGRLDHKHHLRVEVQHHVQKTCSFVEVQPNDNLGVYLIANKTRGKTEPRVSF